MKIAQKNVNNSVLSQDGDRIVYTMATPAMFTIYCEILNYSIMKTQKRMFSKHLLKRCAVVLLFTQYSSGNIKQDNDFES